MNWKKTISRTITYVFCGVAAVQIVLGAIWLCCQFPHLQNWQETYEYLDISRTWVLDEYVGFLYPLLLKLCTGMEALLGVPFYMPVYVVQLLAAVFASYFFARTVLKLQGGRAYLTAGYLVSFPMLLQFHLSVRPESLVVSGVLLLLGVFSNKQDRTLKQVVCGGLLTMAVIWLMPDGAVLCVAAWVWYFLGKIDRKWFLGLLAFVLALAVSLSVNAFTQTPGSRGRIQKTFWAAAFQRVVTEYFSKSYAMWDEEVRTTFTIEEAMEQAKRSDNMMYTVGPMLERDWGRERANQLYRQMTMDCFRVRTKDVVYQIRDDLVDALLMPFSTWWQDDGGRRSQTGWNYGRLLENARGVASVYFLFGRVSLLGVLICGIVKKIFNRKNVRVFRMIIAPACIALVQCFWEMLRTGNAVSYSKLSFVILFWMVLGAAMSLGEKQEA